ncbi:MAG: penicillin-binding protein activator [Proteobacteria bacterium]|nr:penicillin-binding protein activator [Pseudomonadota bacterium]
MRTVYLICFILLTSSCGNQVIRPDRDVYIGLQQAQDYYDNDNFTNAASAYVRLFNDYQEDRFALLAADSFLQVQQYQQAQEYLSLVKSNTHPLKEIIQAELNFVNGIYDYHLNEVNGQYRARYLMIKAKNERANQNYLSAALSFIELSELDDSFDYSNEIITSIMLASNQELSTSLFNLDLSLQQQGWIQAATAALSKDQEAIDEWKIRWQNHPAIVLFNQSSQYNNVAVLLPLSGKYKNIAKSIQQGMVAALHNNNSGQRLTFFDTGSNGETFSYAWYGAIESGAEFILGPLDKSSIQQMAQINSSSIPILALNQLNQESQNLGYYQFALSKQDEVINVAQRLFSDNKKRIMLLAPESEQGRKLAMLFEKEFTYLGGKVVRHAFYPESTHDYTREIKQAIGLNDSTVRARALKTIIGKSFKSKPQIRPDIDAIFIMAKAKNARLIKPQLKFFQAKDVPVYATSQVYSSNNNPELDKDLNGIRFCQSQFVIAPETLQKVLNFATNKVKSNKKFFAFGYDAVSLIPRLEWMHVMQSQKVEGLSGFLRVDGDGKVRRELAWAEYRKGIPVLLPDLVKVENQAQETE